MSDRNHIDADLRNESANARRFVFFSSGLPTPPTPSLADNPPLSRAMASNFKGKGKGKRPAMEMETDDENTGPVFSTVVAEAQGTGAAFETDYQSHHRHHSVAATVWGPYLPGSNTPQPFNIYKTIIRNHHFFAHFVSRLPISSLVDLYAIDKEFHFRFNRCSTSLLSDFVKENAWEAAQIFSWVLAPELCISDPMLRPMDGRPHLARDVPTIRWAKMVMYRDAIVYHIPTLLALDGLHVPHDVPIVLMKFWLLMEMRTNSLRRAFIKDKHVWSDQELLHFLLFFVKLDMRFSHPVRGLGFGELGHTMLTQKGLTPLFDQLIGDACIDYDDAVQMLVRTYPITHLNVDHFVWLADEDDTGVPREQRGAMCREEWNEYGVYMESAVNTVIKEAIRRDLHPEKYLADFMTYSFVDRATQENIPNLQRRIRLQNSCVRMRSAWPSGCLGEDILDRLDANFATDSMELDGNMVMVMKSSRRRIIVHIPVHDLTAPPHFYDDEFIM